MVIVGIAGRGSLTNWRQVIAENVTERPATWGVEICDRCGVRAQYLAFKDENLLLTFCGHHGQIMQLALIGAGWEVDALDE